MRQKCCRWSVILCALGVIAAGRSLVQASDLPPVGQVLRGIVERAQTPNIVESPSSYRCTKQTITEDFDSAGHVTSRKIKVGESESRHGAHEANKWGSKNGINLDAELLQRYEFTLVERETVNGRPTLLLTFVPKDPPVPIQHIQDRLLNRTMGSISVDEREFELVKANISLAEPISFGVFGAIEVLRFGLERERAQDGSWLTRSVDTAIKARKFMTPISTRKHEEWTDFRRLAVR